MADISTYNRVRDDYKVQTFETYAEAGAYLKDRNPNLTINTERAARSFEKKNPHLMKVLEGMPFADKALDFAMKAPGAARNALNSIPVLGAMSRVVDNPIDPSTGEARRGSESPNNALTKLFGGVSALDDKVKEVGDVGSNFMSGISSGMTLGGTEQLSQAIGNKPKSGMAFGAGELIGEMIMPYKAARLVLGMTKMGGRMMGQEGLKGILGRAAMGGAESAMVEMPKSIIRGEDLDEAAKHGAIAFGVGTAFPLLLRGSYVAGKKGIERWLGPGKGEIDDDLVRFLREEDLLDEAPASILRPTSDMISFVQQRTMASAATRKIYTKSREKLTTVVDKMRDRISLRLGDNVTAQHPSEVGTVVVNDITKSLEFLKDSKNAAYDKVSLSIIGKTPIKPNLKMEIVYPDANGDPGRTEKVSLFEGLEDIIGLDVLAGASPAISPARRKLMATYKWAKKNATKVETTTDDVHIRDLEPSGSKLFADVNINPATGKPLPSPGRRPRETTEQANVRQDIQGVQPVESLAEQNVRLDLQGRPIAKRTTTEVVYKDYNWWWNRAKEIGSLLDQKAVVESPADRQMVGRAYHLIRDVIDRHGEEMSIISGDGSYKTAIDAARASHINYTTFQHHPLVNKFLVLGSLDNKSIAEPEKIMPLIFNNTSAVREVKHILGPDAFNQVRQSWLHSLLIDAIELESNGTIQGINAKKLMAQLRKYGWMDESPSSLIIEMFSDEGFVTPDGAPISGVTEAPIKLEDFKKFVHNVGLLSEATELMKTAGRPDAMGGSSQERFSGGRFSSPRSLLDNVKTMALSMIVAKKGAEELQKGYGKSIFLGGSGPEAASIDADLSRARVPFTSRKESPLSRNPNIKLTEETMGQGTSAVLNRIMNR